MGLMTRVIKNSTKPRTRRTLPRLSAAEMELLEMLWREGAVTLSEAHRSLALPIGYTTVQTRLNRLVKKGLVTRGDERPARYQPAVSREDICAQDLNLLVKRVSGGVVPLVAHLVRERSLSAAEVKELKRLISEAESRLAGDERKRKL
ncbi:MAG TPA: BlaI/MecI/CopY family transcriptional regulator [Pirellulales bacterium]|nr:BlaI/MecI/CopY family transcriptional regulator [Pirellulales bacterium]